MSDNDPYNRMHEHPKDCCCVECCKALQSENARLNEAFACMEEAKDKYYTEVESLRAKMEQIELSTPTKEWIEDRDHWKALAGNLYTAALNEHFRHRCDAKSPCSLCLALAAYSKAAGEDKK